MTTPVQPAASAPSGLYLRLADAIVAGGALIMFLFSFAPFISVPGVTGLYGGVHQNAWSFETPVALFVVFAAILLIGTAAVDSFWHRSKQMVGFHRHQIQVGLALYALVTLVAFALADKSGASFGWGGIFMLIGALIATAGAVLNHLNMMQGPIGMPNISVSQPAAYQPPTQGYPSPSPAPSPSDPTQPSS